MRQPVIDPEKVNAWTESMRGVFGVSNLGTLLVVGFFVAFCILMVAVAMSDHKHRQHHAHR